MPVRQWAGREGRTGLLAGRHDLDALVVARRCAAGIVVVVDVDVVGIVLAPRAVTGQDLVVIAITAVVVTAALRSRCGRGCPLAGLATRLPSCTHRCMGNLKKRSAGANKQPSSSVEMHVFFGWLGLPWSSCGGWRRRHRRRCCQRRRRQPGQRRRRRRPERASPVFAGPGLGLGKG